MEKVDLVEGVTAAGTLPSNGRYFWICNRFVAVTPDQNGHDPNNEERPGGRTIPCTRGVYWRDQGKSPCEDLGTIKFRTPDGTEISNTAEITRGYKSGYNIIQTKGVRGGEVVVTVDLVPLVEMVDIMVQVEEDQVTLMDL